MRGRAVKFSGERRKKKKKKKKVKREVGRWLPRAIRDVSQSVNAQVNGLSEQPFSTCGGSRPL